MGASVFFRFSIGSVRPALRALVCLAGSLALVGTVAAGELNLSWDPSSGASGYRVFTGTSSGSYGSPQDVGNVTTRQALAVPDCTQTYFAVKAYNAAGEF